MMSPFRKVLCCAAAVVCLSAAMAPAAGPLLITYQGKLTDSSGNPITGQVNLQFALYDAESGGTRVWGTEPHLNVPIENGLYSIQLGSGVPLDGILFDNPYWLQIYVGTGPGTETLTPRQQLTTSPYAMRAIYSSGGASANNITGGAAGQILYQSAVDTTAKLPIAVGSGKFLKSNGAAAPSWELIGPSSLMSGDYLNDIRVSTALYVTNADTVDGAHAGNAAGNVLLLNGSGYVPTGNLSGDYLADVRVSSALYIPASALPVHNHSANDINSGSLGSARLAGDYLADVRVSSALYIPASALPVHNHSANDINSGSLGSARLAGDYLADVRVSSALYVSNADTVDGYHAGTSASNVLLLDGSGNVPSDNIHGDYLADVRVSSALYVSNADTVDGHHAGTAAGEVLLLNGSGYVPSTTLSGNYLNDVTVSSATFAVMASSVNKANVELDKVENTALSTWAGSANITTVGKIAPAGVILPKNSGFPELTELNNRGYIFYNTDDDSVYVLAADSTTGVSADFKKMTP